MQKKTTIEKTNSLDTISDIVLNEFGILRRVTGKFYDVKLDMVQITLENYSINLQMSDKFLSVELFEIRALNTNELLQQVKNVSLVNLMTNLELDDTFTLHDSHSCYY